MQVRLGELGVEPQGLFKGSLRLCPILHLRVQRSKLVIKSGVLRRGGDGGMCLAYRGWKLLCCSQRASVRGEQVGGEWMRLIVVQVLEDRQCFLICAGLR